MLSRNSYTFASANIYTHHRDDLNLDHELTFLAVLTAARPVEKFVHVNDIFEIKTKTFKCYKKGLRKFKHPCSIDAIDANAKKWGSTTGKKQVEPLELIRKVMD